MTLRIDRLRKRIRLSGEFRSEHVHQVKAEIDQCGTRSVLDMEELDLVDVEAIHFLNSCEARGVSVSNASAYIRAWMVQERERPTHQQSHPGFVIDVICAAAKAVQGSSARA
jgi:hypothetical protein